MQQESDGLAISNEEVVVLLRRMASGKVLLQTIGPTWNEMYAGDVVFLVEGWRVTIFNDCDSFDYVDHIVAPDGREVDFSDWWPDGGDDNSPEHVLTSDERNQLEEQLKKAGRLRV